jgi:DNA topoisomerase-3
MNAEIEAKKTKPPAEYNEASLLYDMTNPARLVKESDLKKIFKTEVGIGTQATRAQIIETLIKRNYIERSKKNLLATTKGIFLIEKLKILPSTKHLTSIEQTAELELLLQDMSEGLSDDTNFLEHIHTSIDSALVEWKSVQAVARADKKDSVSIGVCPVCKADIKSFPKSYSCSRWREGCKFTVWKVMAKKKIPEIQVEKLVKLKRSDLIKGFKSKAGKSFEAYLIMNQEGLVTFEYKN